MKFLKPFGTGLKCDQLRMVFRPPVKSVAAIVWNIQMMIETGMVYHPFTIKQVEPIRGYGLGVFDAVLMRGAKEIMRMQVGNPDMVWLPALVVSYSPEVVWLYGADKLVWKILNSVLCDQLAKWHLFGHIREIHAAYDVAVSKEDIYFWYSYSRQVRNYGDVDPSHYLNKRQCPCQFMMYNKTKELYEKYGIDIGDQFEQPITRFEWRWRPEHKIDFFDGPRLWENPMMRLKVFDRQRANEIMASHPKYAALAATLLGYHPDEFSAIVKKMLSPYMRRQLFELLAPSRPGWWAPEIIWDEWPETLLKYECAKQFTS